MIPKIDGEFQEAPERAEARRVRLAERFTRHRAVGRGVSDEGEQAPGRARLTIGGAFSTRRDRDDFWGWLVSDLQADPPAFGRVSRHDCREDEPEPVHLPYEDIAYQQWRVDRDCRRHGFEEIVIGEEPLIDQEAP